MERVKKDLFLTYFPVDPILDVSAGSVEIHFYLALLSEVKKKLFSVLSLLASMIAHTIII